MSEIPSRLLPTYSIRMEHAIATHCIDVDSSVSPDMALNSNFWVHLAQKFRVGDEVLVRPSDRSYRLHAEVIAIDPDPGKHWAKLREISLIQGAISAVFARDEDGYRIDHDPEQNYRILRGRDLVAKDFATENDARAALANLKAGRKPVAPKAALADLKVG